MATIYFTNNLDDSTDSGSLRYAIANAATGDTIMYNGSETGDIEIAINSVLPSKSIKIVGTPTQRIIFNGQGNTRFYNVSTSLNMEFRYVDFKNGYRSDASPFYISRLDSDDSWTFESCRFYGGHGTYSGAVQIASSSSGTVGQFTFNNCVAFNNESTGTYNSGVSCPVFLYVANASNATVLVSNCTLGKGTNRDSVGGLGGTVTKTNCLIDGENNVDFATAGFVDAANYDFRLLPTSSYLTGSATTGVDFLGHSRSGEVGAFAGSWLVVKTNYGVATDLSVDYAEFADGSYIAFANNHILTVKKETYCGTNVEFYSGSVGYFSTPTPPTATYTNVRACSYGAGVTSVSLSLGGVSWTASDLTVPVLVEKQNGSDWNVLTNSAMGGSYSTTIDYGDTVRVFDGVQFLSATITAPATYKEIAESYALGYVIYDSVSVGYIQ